ncbi:efflux RND transporter periplasmic adaptor subunit [Acidipropionibacterium timonense]|uniref:peptidoglycan-binding protein n=1 Tax=Acidipropionibacterium timonense TaxID=2161818 RepID=UPI00103118CC|nr:peptidoglycan-binding protein [Acidipropionibacterium timonense]
MPERASSDAQHGHRVLRTVLGLLVLMALLAGAFWAGRVTMGSHPLPEALPQDKVTVTVREGTVGRTLLLNTTVKQARVPIATNALAGVVTSVGRGGHTTQGQVLYSVNGRVVRAVQGATPFYRSLSVGTVGDDVRQLNEALIATKAMTGPATRRFTTDTKDGVETWQEQAGEKATGTIDLGELVAVPTLPASLTFDSQKLRSGAVLVGGEPVVLAPAGKPTFTLELGRSQVALVPSGSAVTMTWQDRTWTGVITKMTDTDDGNVAGTLEAPSGGPVCGTDCALLQGSDQISIPSQIQTVKETSGPIVPVAALTTGADGTVHVTVVKDGTTTVRAVTILASQDGQAVVKGVRVGETVQVLADTASTSQGQGGAGEASGTAAPSDDHAASGNPAASSPSSPR